MATIKGNSGNNNLTGTTGNDFIYGYDGQDTLTGLGGNDRLEGGNGNDTLDGGTGADTMIGGSGDDTYIVDSTSDVITEVTGGGIDTIKTSISYTLGENYVNNLILTGSSNLNGTGNSYENVITGNAGNNTLRGNAGKDTIDGGNGIDTLIGGTGDDTYIVNSITDVITEVSGQGIDTVISSVTYTLDENYVNNLTLTSSSNLNGTGNSYDNIITDNKGDNVIRGGDGNDTLYQGSGSDTLYGEKGDDFLYTTSKPDGADDDSVYNQSNLLKGGDGNDTLSSFGAGKDTLYGDAGNDVLSGGDTEFDSILMYGGDGNDTLDGVGTMYGDAGNDNLVLNYYGTGYGGLGYDTITCYNDDSWGANYIGFNSSNEGVDTIINFESLVNEIEVSASGFGGGLTQYDYLTSEQFAIGSSASTTSQRFLYDTSTGYLRFDADGNGSASSSVVLAILQGAPTLAYTDIYVI